MQKNIQIILVEDSPDYRDVIAFGLSNEANIEIVDQFNTADAALRSLQILSDRGSLPDLILLDLNMPGQSGLDAIPQFKKTAPKVEIIVLTESQKEADILTAITRGAVGYLLKNASLNQIIDGIRSVMEGGAPIDPFMARYLLDRQKNSRGKSPLSPREFEILPLLAEGDLQKQIADTLKISPKTVDFHIGHIYKKLNAQNAPAAVANASKSGILRS